MFTGIVEELGVVRGVSRRGKNIFLEINAKKIWESLNIGDSVSVNGACLTLVKKDRERLSFEVMPESARTTNLGSLKIAEKVNLERSLKLGDRLSGHFVTGHIDCIGIIRKKYFRQNNLCFEIAIPEEFSKFSLPKGSVAFDGISLTLAGKTASSLTVYIIPHTLQNTTLGLKSVAGRVNIEFDILAKKASIM